MQSRVKLRATDQMHANYILAHARLHTRCRQWGMAEKAVRTHPMRSTLVSLLSAPTHSARTVGEAMVPERGEIATTSRARRAGVGLDS